MKVCLRGFSIKGHDVSISLSCWAVVDPFSDIMPLAQEDKIIQFSPWPQMCAPREPYWNLVRGGGESGHKNCLCSHTRTDAHLLL
jgi:hypothetical protein